VRNNQRVIDRLRVARGAALRLLGACALLLAPAVLLLGPRGNALSSNWLRAGILLLCGVLGGLLLPLRRPQWLVRSSLGLMIAAAIIYLLQPFTAITSYPFSLSWSEGNRFWASSLYFRREYYQVVGQWGLPGYLSPGFHGLYGLPFLLPRPTIVLLRLWEALLTVFPAMGLITALTFRTRAGGPGIGRLALTLWGFLFLMQGPIYAPLLVAAIAFFLLWSPDRPLRSGLVVIAASFYLGISRWTWMIAPGVWSVTWVLLADARRQPDSRRRWARAIEFGLAGAAGGALSLAWTGWVAQRPVLLYLVSLHHLLLKYRLLPNATSHLGILPWISIVAAPSVVLLLWGWWTRRLDWDRWSIVAAGACAIGLFVVGLAASIKIGAGDNLHGLDMFLVYVVLLVVLAATELAVQGGLRPGGWPFAVKFVLTAAVFVASLSAVREARPLQLPPQSIVAESLATVRSAVSQAAPREIVLFIDQRQLLAFDTIPGVSLVPEYELVDLMDRAMASDEANLARFYHDLEAHRFSLIIADPLPIIWRDRSWSFGEENDIWTRDITIPILDHYQPVAELEDVGVWLLEPRPEGSGSTLPSSSSLALSRLLLPVEDRP
jgi:hypothetical protein